MYHMNHFSGSKTLAGILSIAFMCAPIITSAQTTTVDVGAQMQSLMNQIKALQQQLQALRGSVTGSTHREGGNKPDFAIHSTSTMPRPGDKGNMMGEGDMNRGKGPACAAFARTLRMGSRGDDVRNLQGVLREHDLIASSSITGFFGPQTAEALARFQAKFGIASSSAPLVGPMTRGLLQKLCVQGQHGDIGMLGDKRNGTSTPPMRDGKPFMPGMPPRPDDKWASSTRPIMPPRPCMTGATTTRTPMPPCPPHPEDGGYGGTRY